jgi:predicted O-methyltransferase YrrM
MTRSAPVICESAISTRSPSCIRFFGAPFLTWALELSRPGTLIVADNVVRAGAVVDSGTEDPSVVGVRRFFDLLAAEPRVSATAIQTVGEKGYDGFALALVL